MRSRRLPAAVVALLVLAGSSACIRQEGNGVASGPAARPTKDNLPDCPVDALDEATGTVEIEVWHSLVAETKLYAERLAEEFNASQDEVEVTFREQGTSYDQVLNKYVAGIPSKQVPAIAFLEDTSLRQLVDSGSILPAEACERADSFTTGQLPVVRTYYTSEDIYWPGYTNVSEPILYYNAVQLQRAGLDPSKPPQTLDELRTYAEALKESGVQAPLALKLDEWFVESWVSGVGETVVNMANGREGRATESTFDNPATHRLYEWIKGMVDDGLLQGYSDTAGQINHYLALAQKSSSFGPETSTSATTIKAVLGGTTYEEGAGVPSGAIETEGLQVRAGPFPGLDEPAQVRVSGGAFYMSNLVPPEQQAAAWEFMKFMWTTDAQVGWHLQGSYLPTTQAAANNPEVVAYWESDLAGQLLKTGYDELLQISEDRPGPQIGPYLDYAAAIKGSLDRLVQQGASVDDVIAQADREIQAALEAYNEDNAE